MNLYRKKQIALMLKKLTKYGNSNALILDKTLLSLLDLKEDSLVKIKVHGDTLTITAAKDIEFKEKLEASLNTFSDSLPDDYKSMHEKFLKKALNDVEKIDEGEYENQKEKFKEFFQKEDIKSCMMDISTNPKVREITNKLMKECAEGKIDFEEFPKLYLEELKNIDTELYEKMIKIQEGSSKHLYS